MASRQKAMCSSSSIPISRAPSSISWRLTERAKALSFIFFRRDFTQNFPGLIASHRVLENESEAAAEATRRMHQQELPAVGHRERQVSLGQQVAQVGGRFHVHRYQRERPDRLPDVNIQPRFRA